MDINNIIEQIKPIDRQKVEEAQNRFDNLIKPVGSLAKLEAMVSRYAGIVGSADKKFEDRFVRALTQMASSLHSGMTVEQAIDSVVNCELLHESIRDDFRILSSKMKLGTSISDAFFKFAKDTENKDVFDVATAITIMTDVGGDAGEAIEKLQKNIEDRLMYRKKRQSMMTESQIIVLFADIMPIVILAGTYLFMPEVIKSYFESSVMTIAFLVIVAILLVGSVVVHKMLGNKMDLN